MLAGETVGGHEKVVEPGLLVLGHGPREKAGLRVNGRSHVCAVLKAELQLARQDAALSAWTVVERVFPRTAVRRGIGRKRSTRGRTSTRKRATGAGAREPRRPLRN